jgi:uncharacterized protein YjiS (DUF1127 family)
MTMPGTDEVHTLGAASALPRLVQVVISGVMAFIRATMHRREVYKLLEMDDRSLRDIGLIRNDVVGALAQPWAKDPSVVLLVRRVDRLSRLRTRVVPTQGVAERRRAKADA